MLDTLFNLEAITSSTAEFKEIQKKRSRLNFNNPFFILMQELLQDNQCNITEFYDPISIECLENKLDFKLYTNRLYIFFSVNQIDIQENILHLNDKSYKLINRHLTIDQKFLDTDKKHGLYPAHYTEEYTLLTEQPNPLTIKIHVYLDKHGNCSYVEVKQHILIESKESIFVKKIENFEDYTVLKNCELACKLFSRIIQKRNKLLEDLIAKSNQLEQESTLLLHKYMFNGKNQEDFERFQVKAEKFIEIVNKINKYSDNDLDMRDQAVKTILEKLTPLRLTDNTPEETADSSNNCEIDVNPATMRNPNTFLKEKKLVDINENIENLIHRLKQIDEQYKLIQGKSVLNILQKLNLQQQAKSILLQLEFMPQKTRLTLTEHHSIIEKMNGICFSKKSIAENQKLIEQIFNSFKDYCVAGDLIHVTKIFQYIKHKIDDDFLKNLINEILENCICFELKSKSKTDAVIQEQNIVEILNFLYNNVPRYQTILPYIIESNATFIKKFKLISLDNYTLLCFPLLSCAIHNKLSLFETLLRQGVSPNGTGLLAINKENSFYALSIIKSCLIMHDNIKPVFINKLFEYGASIINQQYFTIIDLNLKRSIDILKSESLTRSIASLIKSLTGKIHFETIPEYHYFAQVHPHLETGLMEINIAYIDKCLDQVLEHSSPIDIIVLFLYLVSKSGNEQVILHDRQHIKQKFIINFDSKLNLENCYSNHCSYLTYIYNVSLADKEHSSYIHMAIEKLYNRVLMTSTKKSSELDYLIKATLEQATLINLNKEFSTMHQKYHMLTLKHSCLKAVLLLISFKDKFNSKDLEIISEMYQQRSNLFNIILELQSYDKELERKRDLMQNLSKQVPGTLQEYYSKHLMFSFNSNKSTILTASCEPPPGSIKVNDITIVP